MGERISINEFAMRLGGGELPATTQARFVVKEAGVSINSTEPLLILNTGLSEVDARADLRDLFEVEITDPTQ